MSGRPRHGALIRGTHSTAVEKPAKSRLVALSGMRDPLCRQHQQCPVGIVQMPPGHKCVPLGALNSSKVALPAPDQEPLLQTLMEFS